MNSPPDLDRIAASVLLARDIALADRVWLSDRLRRLASGVDPREVFPRPPEPRLRNRDTLVRTLAGRLPARSRWQSAQAIAGLLVHPDDENVAAPLQALARGIRSASCRPLCARQIFRILSV